MSSPPPHQPYKSKVFNTINRTFLNWSDRSKISINQLKIAVKWGVQILLYPIYLGIQTARMTLNQILKPYSPHKTLYLEDDSPIVSEIQQPITTILTEINNQLPTPIQGIATELESQKIVLITGKNKLLHLANEIQEKQLKNWIKWEIANYWRKQRIELLDNKNPWYLTPIKKYQPHVIFPLNIFWQLMAWEEKSPIATTLNVFGELELINATKTLNIYEPVNNYLEKKNKEIETNNFQTPHNQTINIKLISPSFISKIDEKISTLETNPKITDNMVKIIDTVEILPEKIKDTFSQLNFKSDRDNPFTIQAIIMAAIDYFFGESNSNKNINSNSFNFSDGFVLPQESSEVKSLINQGKSLSLQGQNHPMAKALNSNSLEENIIDPWLNSTDLFTPINHNNQPSVNISTPPLLNRVNFVPKTPVKNSGINKIKQFLSRQEEIKFTPIDNSVNSITINHNRDNIDFVDLNYPLTHSNSIEWEEKLVSPPIISSSTQDISSPENSIETPATHIGYEKHFLEYILGWLDHIMMLIEEFFVNVLKWFKHKI
jgi:hypothetical protein